MISPGKTVVLTFDDAVSNHAAFAAPLLSELGFHATFFICEFPPDFAVNKRQYMTWEQIRSLDAAGFEIANHTMTHAGLSAMASETCEKEIELLEARFRDVGLPRSRAFGYPGGPAADYAPPLLKKLGFRFARTVEDRAWKPDRDDPYLIPAVAVHGADDSNFRRALSYAQSGGIPVLVYHGIPDRLHPWVDTPPELFESEMRYLKRENYRVLAFRDLLQS